MPIIKKYNTSTTQWDPIAVGATGPLGPTGPAVTGPTGPQGATGPQGDWSTAQVVSTKSSGFTLELLDAGKIIKCSSSSAFTVTIPTEAVVAFAVGQKIDLIQYGTGQITVVGDTGVVLKATPTSKLRTQNSIVACVKIGADEWILAGDLALS
jgi:hypothetical protein